jgi:predicted HTH domain antitoxin
MHPKRTGQESEVMSHTIRIELEDDILLGMQKDDRTMAAELRLAAAVKWYECGVLSQEKAAEVAGMSRAEFIFSLARFQGPSFQESKARFYRT